MEYHTQVQNFKERRPKWATTPAILDPRLYRVSFPRYTGYIGCLVGGCKGWLTTCTNLQIHFVHRHMRDTIVIIEEGNYPRPLCWACDMIIPWAELNLRHLLSNICAREAESKRWSLV